MISLGEEGSEVRRLPELEDFNRCADGDDGENLLRGGTGDADAAMGGWAAWDVADVEANAVIGQSHPKRHRSTNEFSTFGDGSGSAVSIGIDDFSLGIVNLAIQIGVICLFLFEDREFSGGGWEREAAGGDGELECDEVLSEEVAALGIERDDQVRFCSCRDFIEDFCIFKCCFFPVRRFSVGSKFLEVLLF